MATVPPSFTRTVSFTPPHTAIVSAPSVFSPSLMRPNGITEALVETANVLRAEVDEIAARHQGIDRDNVRHALILLREKPVERLKRALVRGKTAILSKKYEV